MVIVAYSTSICVRYTKLAVYGIYFTIHCMLGLMYTRYISPSIQYTVEYIQYIVSFVY